MSPLTAAPESVAPPAPKRAPMPAGFDAVQHLAELDAQGYTIIADFLDAQGLARVREGLAPHLQSHAGRNYFEGFKTERV
jgi:hypothetical protein